MARARKAPARRLPPTQGADREGWWSEAVSRLEAGESIRSLAKRFGTNPRRLRRALAREGVRAHGQPLRGRVLQVLWGQRHRLGFVSDGALARELGLTPEAVAGARRRLGIDAFRPKAKPKASGEALSEEEMDWIRGPRRPERSKRGTEPELEIVNRTGRGEVIRSLVRRPAPPAPGTVVVASHPAAELPPVPAGSTSTLASVGPPTAPTPPPATAASTPISVPVAGTPQMPAPGVFTAPTLIRERAEFVSERQRELDELLSAPRREREGRQRIVRSDEGEPVTTGTDRSGAPAQAPQPASATPRRARAEKPAWREVPPAVSTPASVPEPLRDAAPTPPAHADPPGRAARSTPATARAVAAVARPDTTWVHVWFEGLSEPLGVQAGSLAEALRHPSVLAAGRHFAVAGVARVSG